VRNNPKISCIVQGNHDEDTSFFEPEKYGIYSDVSHDAFAGIKYNASILSNEEKEWLKSLPDKYLVKDEDLPFWICHYSPDYCTEWGYIMSVYDASCSFRTLKKWDDGHIFLFGHSHVPTLIEQDGEGIINYNSVDLSIEKTYKLSPSFNYLINPGSIGQPRYTGLTSYAILNTEEKTVKFNSFEYNVEEAQKVIREAGYSMSIANRLDPHRDEKLKQAKKQRCKNNQKHIDAEKK